MIISTIAIINPRKMYNIVEYMLLLIDDKKYKSLKKVYGIPGKKISQKKFMVYHIFYSKVIKETNTGIIHFFFCT